MRDNISKAFSVPVSNFDNFVDALLTVFIVFANDGWTTIYFDYYRAIGAPKATLFFVILVILGQMILFNLFLAILLKEFDERSLILEKQ